MGVSIIAIRCQLAQHCCRGVINKQSNAGSSSTVCQGSRLIKDRAFTGEVNVDFAVVLSLSGAERRHWRIGCRVIDSRQMRPRGKCSKCRSGVAVVVVTVAMQ